MFIPLAEDIAALALDVIALAELEATFCELVLPTRAGAKLVGITTEDPKADNVPVLVPVVDSLGITDPAKGTKVPFCIVPPIGVVVPPGVNVATVPSGILPPVNVIIDISVPPTVPVVGVVGEVPSV